MPRSTVIKFGGADLESGEKIRKAAEMVVESGYSEIVVVVSAMAGTTNSLIEVMSQVGNVNDRDYADIVSMGERTSARIFCSALKAQGADAVYLDPDDERWPIITDSNFRNAKPDMTETCERVRRHVKPLLGRKIVVVCGFLGRDKHGNITTLGRGGSDTTALILANCLGADEVVLVKETEGVMSADPRMVPQAKPLKKLDIHEMFAMSYGGAKIIKAEALRYKLAHQRLRVVRFSNGIVSEGTEIVGVFNPNSSEIAEKKGLSAVSVVCDINPENVSKIIASFGNRPIYGISTGRVSLTVFTSSEKPKALMNDLHNLGVCKILSLKSHIGLIELTNPAFVDSPGWIAKVSGALAEKGINIVEATTSKSTINFFVDESKIDDAVKVVRDALET
ncbi:aspartate kinase [Candidatus Bathyarchaeota archaeon]|nr:MAG: aspartate kinase [Candidatus Bathyarchaeota archaeon]